MANGSSVAIIMSLCRVSGGLYLVQKDESDDWTNFMDRNTGQQMGMVDFKALTEWLAENDRRPEETLKDYRRAGD